MKDVNVREVDVWRFAGEEEKALFFVMPRLLLHILPLRSSQINK